MHDSYYRLAMIAKVEKLNEKSHEGRTLRKITIGIYILLGISGPVYIGVCTPPNTSLRYTSAGIPRHLLF